MTKKRFFTSALATVICGSVCICSLPASAEWYGEQEVEIPDGYTQVENQKGYYQNIEDSRTNILSFDFYYTNFTKLIIPSTAEAEETFYEIYADYEEAIGADDCLVGYTIDSGENYSVRIYEYEYMLGKDIADAEEKEFKEDVILQLCADLQEAGILISGTYMPHAVSPSYGYFYQELFITGVDESEMDGIAEIVAQYDADTEITYVTEECADPESAFVGELDAPYISIDNIEDYDIALTIENEICTAYPDAECVGTDIGFLESSSSELYSTAEVDLLAALSDGDDEETSSVIGDVSLDGAVNLSDAILIQKYASGAIALSDTALLNADVNADGDIDGSDALILLRYQTGYVSQLPYTS